MTLTLLDLPVEILTHVFKSLGADDLPCLLTAQRTCRSFKACLLFDSLEGASKARRSSDDRSDTRPHVIYNKLPPTWRDLSVTWGGPRITRLDVVKVLTVYGGTSMSYHQLALPDSGLTMEMLYDLLLERDNVLDVDGARWQLFVGRQLGSYDEWQRPRARCQYPNQIVKLLVGGEDVRHSAVLYVDGHRDCNMGVRYRESEAQGLWELEPIGDRPLEVCRWQGCDIGITRCI
ncbi:Uu.00g052790.m01.CDS01 [Anthostomella pinea]|uniref:Uu.00g052790.m01.CDS01 n=1 Tax=Anthostomella pinea TaxID=933095 RepID=A0AAI8VWB0_9PEZI|nr:Uu.00g052790.m01.CDS01 [Anthostomella pinea]